MSDSPRGPSRIVWLLLGLGAIAGLARSLTHRRPRLAGVDPEDLAAGREVSDLNGGVVAVLGVALMSALLIVVLAVTWLQLQLAGSPTHLGPLLGEASLPNEALPAEPRLEAVPGETLGRIRAVERERLHSYSWVSREDGTVRIPIDLAMDLLSARGLPADTSGASAGEVMLPSDASSGRVEQRVWP